MAFQCLGKWRDNYRNLSPTDLPPIGLCVGALTDSRFDIECDPKNIAKTCCHCYFL